MIDRIKRIMDTDSRETGYLSRVVLKDGERLLFERRGPEFGSGMMFDHPAVRYADDLSEGASNVPTAVLNPIQKSPPNGS